MSMFKISIRTPQFHCVIDIPKDHDTWEFVSFTITDPASLTPSTIASLTKLRNAMAGGGAIIYHKPTLTLSTADSGISIQLSGFLWTVGTTKGAGTIVSLLNDIATTLDYVSAGTI